MAQRSMRSVWVLFAIVLLSLMISTTLAKKSIPYQLDFTHTSATVQTIDFDDMTQQELEKHALFLVEVDARKLVTWGQHFEPILVDYIPDNLFILSTTGAYLRELTHKYDDEVNHVMFYPENIRFSANTNHWIATHKSATSPSQFISKMDQFDRVEAERKNEFAPIDGDGHKSNVIDLSAAFSSLPQRTLNLDLSPLVGSLKYAKTAPIEDYLLSAPRHLQQFEDHYHLVEMAESQEQIEEGQENPTTVRQALDINAPSHDDFADTHGDVVNAGTHGFLAVFVSDTQKLQNPLCEHQSAQYFSNVASEVLDHVKSTHAVKSKWFRNELVEKFTKLQRGDEVASNQSSSFHVASVFNHHNIDMGAFMNTFDANAVEFAAQIPHTISPSSHALKPSLNSLTSLLPFNTAVSRHAHSGNTLMRSTVGMNAMRIQLQSPLFLSNTTYIAETVNTHVNALYSLLDQHNIEGHGSKMMLENKLHKSKLSLAELKTILMSSYNHFLYTHENRQYSYSYGVDSTLYTTSDAYKVGYEQRALLAQYIDSMLFALLQTQSKLTRSEMSTVVGTFITHQINALHELANHALVQISLLSPLYSIELDAKAAILNNFVRFALTVGLDTTTTGALNPDNMSWNGPYNEAGVTGLGVIVHVADTGIDHKSCWVVDAANAVPFTTSYTTETVSSHRKLKSYMKLGDDHDYLNGHGSHVVGSVTGDCLTQTTTTHKHNGAAPKAILAFMDIAKRSAIVASLDFSLVFKHAQANGAIITSNSWGTGTGTSGHIAASNFYSYSARGMDQYLNTNQNLAALFASSNSGVPGFGTLSQQSTSKNAIIIGSTQAGKAAGVRKDPAYANTPAFIEQPTAFDSLHNLYGGSSSTGPTFDGRMKPNFVAPGHLISSIAATEDSASATCTTTLKTGTSMATPASAGLWTLIQQMLQDGRINSGIPLSSHAYSKDVITGTLLHSIALSAAQPLTHRAGYTIAAPQPMRIQTFDLPPVVDQGITWTHFAMGEITGVTAKAQGAFTYIYVRPTRTDPKITTPNRFIRWVPYINCKSYSFTADFFAGTDSVVDLTAPLATQLFVYENPSTTKALTSISATIPTNKQLYLRITHGLHSCTSAPTIGMVFQEFTGATLETSQRWHDATCDTTFDDFPSVQGVSFIEYTFLYLRCPPALACTDKYSTAKLYGNRQFSTNSAVCRAALHANAMNMTMANIGNMTPAEEADEIETGQRDFILAHSGDFPLRVEPQTTYNGVTSLYLQTDGDDDVSVFGFQLTGEPITLSNGQTNELMYLRKLPSDLNFVSGYGIPLLSSVLPLTQYVKLPAGMQPHQVSQRLMGIMSIGGPSNNVLDGQSESYCFMISSKPLANTYQYQYTEAGVTKLSQTWTSGPDNVRASLTWYDIPAALSTTSRTLINDLDLFLYTPDGSEYRGNAQVDRSNNQERVSLLPGTFTPGMYCAVVNAVNVPLGAQRYSLVTNGRGLEKCLPNPLPYKTGNTARQTVSGVWARSGTPSCTATVSDRIVSEFEQFQPSTSKLGANPSSSYFHTNSAQIQIKQGGNCFTVHEPQYTTTQPAKNIFNYQRLSDTTFENAKNWVQDNKQGVAQTNSGSKFAFSGRVYSNSTFEGEYYKQLQSPVLTAGQFSGIDLSPQDLQHLDPLNSLMMENNVDFWVTGQVDSSFNQVTIKMQGTSEVCTYKYARSVEFPDVQYISP